MSGIKKLAGQTLWYGVSSIAARFIGYLLVPLLTYSEYVSPADFGRQSLLYSAIPVLSILFTYGFETAYFRFSSQEAYKKTIYSTSFFSIVISTILLSALLWIFRAPFSALIGFADIPQIAIITIGIIGIDTLNKIPFAKLRQEERPIKYAFVNIAGIFINLVLTWFFINYCPRTLASNPDSWTGNFFSFSTNPIVYVVLANLIQSVITLLLLSKEILSVRLTFDTKLWKEMMVYALPLLIVGFGGIINETFDRLMLKAWLPGTDIFKNEQVGIYNACYKLSILITLFVQAFRMGAEPFFFKQAAGQEPQKIYARVLKFFVIILSVMFLVVSLFLPIWSHLIGPAYRSAIGIVPILLLANIFLGIYYNLSIWFKLTGKTRAGSYITLIGTAITIVLNFIFIPYFGFIASAWATFCCYGTMMLISYNWGQKAYPVPYPAKKITAYLIIAVLVFFIHKTISIFVVDFWWQTISGAIFLIGYILFVARIEKKELEKIFLWQKT